MLLADTSLVKLIKSSGGCTLRKTCNHDGSGARFFAYIENLGKSRFVRISYELFHKLDNSSRVKCAFTTNIKAGGKVQYTHSIYVRR